MANTGKQRSLTVTINKTVAGVQRAGYPITYNGLDPFPGYVAINATMLSTMPLVDYQSRLAAFKTYIEAIETGLSIDAVTPEGSEAYRENLTACRIP